MNEDIKEITNEENKKQTQDDSVEDVFQRINKQRIPFTTTVIKRLLDKYKVDEKYYNEVTYSLLRYPVYSLLGNRYLVYLYASSVPNNFEGILTNNQEVMIMGLDKYFKTIFGDNNISVEYGNIVNRYALILSNKLAEDIFDISLELSEKMEEITPKKGS